ncbi:hypothetical protein J422_07067, partial [Methanocaldococcus villosus KIN24-T80]
MFLIDPFSGISGDMFIAAFSEFIDKNELIKIINKVINAKIDIKKVKKNGIIANKLIISKKDKNLSYNEMKEIILSANIDNRIKNHAISIINILAKAEAKIHGIDLDEVHFHEISEIDTVIDALGAGYIIEKLNLKNNCYYLPINLGKGFVKITHGLYPIPAPATSEILKGFEVFYYGEGELTTPTGAAILRYINPTLLKGSFTYTKVSYGAGDREYELLNTLRVFKL